VPPATDSTPQETLAEGDIKDAITAYACAIMPLIFTATAAN
jgi:hypothetical protein